MSAFVSDEFGHYDIDGVSLACGHVVVASCADKFECDGHAYFREMEAHGAAHEESGDRRGQSVEARVD